MFCRWCPTWAVLKLVILRHLLGCSSIILVGLGGELAVGFQIPWTNERSSPNLEQRLASAFLGEFNESTQHLLILADEEVCEWRGMHGHGSRRNRRLSCGSAGRAVNVWRTSRERLR